MRLWFRWIFFAEKSEKYFFRGWFLFLLSEGLIAHLTGLALQEDIAPILRSLHSHGRAIQGIDVLRPDYAKTTDRSRTGAAHADPI